MKRLPSILVILLFGSNLYLEFKRSGTAKTGNHSFAQILVSTMIFVMILVWGRFFRPLYSRRS